MPYIAACKKMVKKKVFVSGISCSEASTAEVSEFHWFFAVQHISQKEER